MTNVLQFDRVERKKLKYRKTGLLIMAALFLELIWTVYSFSDASRIWQGTEYYAMIYMIPILNVIFFPLTLGILASRLCDMEHKGNNLKLLCTLEKRHEIYNTKVWEGMKYVFWMTLSQLLIVLGMGGVYHYVQPIPWGNLLFFLLEIFVVSVSIFLLQLLLSLFLENQMIPLVIGLLGSFSGLFTLYVPQIRRMTIWGYYVILAPVEYWWDKESGAYGVNGGTCNWLGILVFLGIGATLYLAGRILFEKKEV
ncbi:MAG: ABC transporter permease [Hespellia sp.]|nr:ABC transporter permease [Hespellia sp.]